MVIALSATAHPALAQAAASPEPGLVIGIEGVWSTYDKQLRLGDSISPKDEVTGARGTLVIWFDGSRPMVYRCEAQSCGIRITAPTAVQERGRHNGSLQKGPPKPQPKLLPKPAPVPDDPGTAAEVKPDSWTGLKAAFNKLFTQPERYITAASRGLEGGLKEAVVPLDGSQVDITSALRNLEPATYWLRFEPVDHPGEARAPVQVEWASGKPAAVSAAGLKRGLYRLALVEQSGESAGSDAWILLSAKEHYPAQSAAFQKAVETVAAWPAEADPSAARAVLRAALESLANNGKASREP
jgi:hypothetical protein